MKKIILLIMVVTLSKVSLLAQRTIKGIVKDADNNESMIDASIIIKGTSFGTVTNDKGRFELQVPDNATTIVVSFIGFITQEINITGKDDIEILLKERATLSEQVVITGTMKEVQRSQSAVPIEVFNSKFFLKNPTPNLYESMSNVNGVRPQMQCSVCNTGDIHINGMEGPYTMVMIDGMPIVSGLSTVYGLLGIPNSMVERVEIIKGPASTLYGSEAVGGLINVITKTVEKSPKLHLDLFGTSQLEMNNDFSAKFKLGKLSSLISGNYYNFNNRIDENNDNFTDITNAERISIFNKWSLARADNRRFDIAFRYVTEDRFGGELQWDKAKHYGGDQVYGEHIATNRIEAFGNYDLPLKNPIKLQYSYNKHQQTSIYGKNLYEAHQEIGMAQLTKPVTAGKSDWLFGAALRYTFYDDNTIITADNRNGGANSPSRIWLPGAFVQNEMTFNEKNKLLLGMRYDYNSANGNIFSPRLNYKWTPNNNNTVRLSFGNGYRIVNIYSEEHAAVSGSRIVELSTNIKPEKSYNANLNYVTKLFPGSGFIGLDMSVFWTRFSNKIIADFDTDPNKIIFDNLKGYGVSQGVNMNLDFNFENGMKLIAGATYMDVSAVEKDKITNQEKKVDQVQTPNFTANWALTYTFPKSRIYADFTGAVYSPMRLPILANDFRPEYSPWFTLMNIQVTAPLKNGLEIYAGAKNLLNFKPENPIMRPSDPFDKNLNVDNPNGYTFDTNYNYAPIQGIRGFLGVRYTIK